MISSDEKAWRTVYNRKLTDARSVTLYGGTADMPANEPTPLLTVDSDYTVRDQERMASAHNYFNWQSSLAKRELGQRILEIGCGMGNFTRHLLDRELVVGIDVDPNVIAKLRSRLNNAANVLAEQMDLLDDERFLQLRKHRPDSIVCLNVLEHISDDVRALRNMAAVLPSGGRVVLMIPAFHALYGPIDKNLGHYRRYTKHSLRSLAANTGFRVRSIKYMNTVGFFGWWLNAKVLKKTEQSESQIAFFDNAIVPLLSRLENAIEPPFGQSVFAILDRK